MKTRLTPFSKLLIVVLVISGLVFLVYKTNLLKVIAPGGERTGSAGVKKTDDIIKIGVVTWGGYAGGQYFNEGFKPNKESRFYKDYGFMVDFKVLDDFNDSRNAWKTDEVNLLWATVDAFTTEIAGLKEFEPQIIFQADWSRGGDAVVVRRGINNVADLKGRKVAFAEMTPSHTFLLWLLEAGNIAYNEIEAVKVANAIDAADLFKKQQVDAAVVWSPDDADCVSKVTGSKVLQSTKQASYIISDIFVAKKDYVEKNREKLTQLLEGWMKGAAEINNSETAKQKAAKILSEGLQQPVDFCMLAINNVRLCTYGDNVNFFNLKGNFTGVTGEDIYNKMSVKYAKIGYETANIPSWRLAGNASLISAINLAGPEHAAEGAAKFEQASGAAQTAQAISSKAVRISFPSGSFQLDENSKYIIDNEFLDIAKMFGNARIRIEGNTDNTGSAAVNKKLSYNRAKAVADYLIKQHGFDANRFVIVGNGPDKPLADNSTEEGRAKNRRTDFELLPE
jgi:NitT/TauT family transport system substrate-binding protein